MLWVIVAYMKIQKVYLHNQGVSHPGTSNLENSVQKAEPLRKTGNSPYPPHGYRHPHTQGRAQSHLGKLGTLLTYLTDMGIPIHKTYNPRNAGILTHNPQGYMQWVLLYSSISGRPFV